MTTNYKFTGIGVLILVGSLFINSCDGIKDSLKGRCIYAGKVYLIDTLGGKVSASEGDSSINVLLYDKDNLVNYIYKSTTKEKGNFSLDFLDKDKEYKITAEYKKNNVKYSGSFDFKADKCDRNYNLSIVKDTVKITLYADIGKRNLINYVVKDQAMAVIPKAEGCLFTSIELFNTRNCLNANYSALSNESGKLSFTDIPEGHYFLYVNKRLDTTANATKLSGFTEIQVAAGFIYDREIQIKQ